MNIFKRFVVFIVALLIAGDLCATVTRIESATSEVGVKFKTMVQVFAVLAETEAISVETYVGTTNIDSFYVTAGNSMSLYSPCDSVYIIRTLATAVTVAPSYNNAITPFLGLNVQSNVVDAEAITITNGYHTAALSSYAFLPLQPANDHNLFAIQISWATADTIWVQALCSDSPMDSTTAFNFGTTAAPVYSKRLILAEFANTAPAGFTATGGYTTAVPFSFVVQDADGYAGIPRFIGVRVRANAAEAITALKIVLYCATLNTCGGE